MKYLEYMMLINNIKIAKGFVFSKYFNNVETRYHFYGNCVSGLTL